MWDMNGEDQYAKVDKKVHDMIAKKLGWDDLEHMIQNKQSIEPTLEKAINMLCQSYKVSSIFK